MRPTLDHSRRWQDSARRIVAMVVALGGHLGLLMVLLHVSGGPRRDRYEPADLQRHSIKLRFFKTMAPLSSAQRTPATRSMTKHAPSPRQRLRPVRTSRATPDHAASAAPGAPLNRAVPHRSAPDYIPGGNLLRGTDLDRQSRVQLPGSGDVIVAGLPMVDPRSQGLAGAVRAVQGMLGVPNGHCLNVDAWRSLSTRELLARHLSPQQVERTAAAYGCGPGKQAMRGILSRCPWADRRRSLCG